MSDAYQSLGGAALALLVVSLAQVTGANSFLAAFAAGIALGTLVPRATDAIHSEGRFAAALAKFAAVFLFGTLITPSWLGRLSIGEWGFALLALLIVRPVAMELSLLGSRLSWRERLVAGWFGPKGFSSVVYAIMILRSSVPDGRRIFHIAAIVIAGSMIAHSSTDTVLSGWLHRHRDEMGDQPRPGAREGDTIRASSGDQARDDERQHRGPEQRVTADRPAARGDSARER